MTENVNKMVQRSDIQRKVHQKVGNLAYAGYPSQQDLFRQLYRDYGPGKFCIQEFNGDINTIFVGWVKDRDPYIVVEVDDERNDLAGIGYEEEEWGDEDCIKIKKDS